MIFLVKGFLTLGEGHFAQRLAEALNPSPPRWPIDDAARAVWAELFSGWEEADLSMFRAREINVDHAVALVVFEQRHNYPVPPRFSTETPPEAFERWRIACCLDVLNKHLARVFSIVCELIDSVPYPVICGSELGSSPQDSLMTRMIMFKYSRQQFLKILLDEHHYNEEASQDAPPTATVFGRTYSPEQLLGWIRRAPDGSLDLAPELAAP